MPLAIVSRAPAPTFRHGRYDHRVSDDLGADGLPTYDGQLSSFHRAFEPELVAMINALPIEPAMQVLDLACGDGFYTRRIADRLGPGGRVIGVDINPAYLDAARRATADYQGGAAIELVAATFDKLPFADATFDVVWCAQSLYSLPDPIDVLRHLARVLEPGGLVAVLENDTMHQVFLPWPVALEIPLRAAELHALARETEHWSKFYVGRRLPAVFATAGFEPLRLATLAFDRQAPFDEPTKVLLQSYLDALRERVSSHLEPDLLAQLATLVDAHSAERLLAQPHLTMSWLNVLALARRPAR